MSVSHSTAALVLASIWLSLALADTGHATQQPAAHKHPPKQAQPVAVAPPLPPPPPPTLEQMPARAPKVSYINGLLTIVAENSTLADILRAVRTQTGASVEIPPNATERVVTHLGPGLTRDVLASLLNGSHFNYVMLGSATHPDHVDRVILTSKSIGTSVNAPPPPPPVQDGAFSGEEQESQAGADISEQPIEDGAEASATEGNQPPPTEQMQVKTPEQLLRELQQQQLQQQQQQQGQGPTPTEGGQQGRQPE